MKIFYSSKESIFSFFRSISVSMFPHFLTKNSNISSIPLFLLIRFFCALVEKDSKLSNFQRNPNGRTKEKKTKRNENLPVYQQVFHRKEKPSRSQILEFDAVDETVVASNGTTTPRHATSEIRDLSAGKNRTETR